MSARVKRSLALADTEVVRRWRSVLVAVAVLVQIAFLGVNFAGRERPYIGPDSVLFEYSGWYAIKGGVPYVHLWDPKPPLVHELAAGIAFVAGGDPLLIHVLSSFLMATATTAVVVLSGELVYDCTEDSRAALASGLALLTYPVFYLLSTHGLRPKMFCLLFGALGILFAFREREFVAGVFSAAAARFWQFGAVFFVLSLLEARSSGRRGSAFVCLGAACTAAVTVAPFALAGALNQLFVETVIAPLSVPEQTSFFSRIIVAVGALDFAAVTVLLGGVGVILSLTDTDLRWIGIGGSSYLAQVLFFDLDGGADLVPGFFFVALGVGTLIARRESLPNGFFGAICVAVLGLAAVTFAQHDIVRAGGHVRPGSLPWLFWNERLPHSCHVRVSDLETKFIASVNEQLNARTCGPYRISLSR